MHPFLCPEPQDHSPTGHCGLLVLCAMQMVNSSSFFEMKWRGKVRSDRRSCKHGKVSRSLRFVRNAGLESSDEEEHQEDGEEAAGDGVDAGEGRDRDAGRAEANGGGEAGEMQSPGGRTGRLLKRPRMEGSQEQQASRLEDDDMDDAVPEFQVLNTCCVCP